VVYLGLVAACGRVDFTSVPADCATAPPGAPCFAMTLATATWDQARTACSQLGPTSHLATIATAEDNAAAAQLAATIPFSASQTNTNQRQRMWLGGSDPMMTGAWQWVDGTAFSYTNWRVGEPGSGGEYCLIILGSQNGLWDNRPCNVAYDAYLCERDP